MLETGQETPATEPEGEPATEPTARPGGSGGGARRIIAQVMAAVGLLVVVALGALAVREGGAISEILLAQPTVTSATGVATATPMPSPTALSVRPDATLAPAVIATGVYWSGNGSAIGQDCQGAQALGSSTFEVDNSHSTVAVDWWVNVANATPDGKQLWASVNMPYGTLPAGQRVTVTVSPNPILCGQLAGRTAPEQYHLDVFYGGVGGAELVDVVKPPAGTPGGG
jgi:hypothetical protein